MALRDLWPEPEWLALGGSILPVSCLTLRDLAALERWAAGRVGTASVLLDRAWGEPDDHARKWLYYRAIEAARTGGPHIEEPAVLEAIDSPAGLAVQLWLSVRHADPTFTLSGAETVLDAVTVGQWEDFQAVAWAADQMDRIQRAIDEEIGVPPFPVATVQGTPGKWLDVVRKAVIEGHLSLDALGDLPLSAWYALAGGTPRRPIASPTRPADWSEERWKAEVKAPRREFFREWWENKRATRQHAQPSNAESERSAPESTGR